MSEKTNKTIQVINVALFCSVLLIGGVISLSMKKKDISETENRKLAAFPEYSDSSLWSGDYFRGIEMYYADNFPYRDKWIDVSTSFRNKLGFESTDIKIYAPENNAEANEKQEIDTTKNQTAGLRPDDGAVGEVKKSLFVFKNRAFEMFGGGPAMGKAYADVINAYNRAGIPNLQVYNLIIPVALEFELTEKYKKLQKPNRPAIEHVYNSLDSNI